MHFTDNIIFSIRISLNAENKGSDKCHTLLGSHVSEGKLILIVGSNKKIAIDGKDIEVTGQKKRIQEIVVLAVGKGFDIPEKSIKHYARCRGEIEYVLVRF